MVCDICEGVKCMEQGRSDTGAYIRASMFVKEALVGAARERKASSAQPGEFRFDSRRPSSMEDDRSVLPHLATASVKSSSSRPLRRHNSWHEETVARKVAVNMGCPKKNIEGVDVPWDNERDCEMSLSDVVRFFASQPSAGSEEQVGALGKDGKD